MKKVCLFVLLFIVSCNNDLENENLAQEKAINILSENGFDVSNAIINGDQIIVENDISFRISNLLNNSRDKGRFQNTGKIDNNRVNKIYIKFHASMTNYWKDVVKEAIKDWNKIQLLEMGYVNGKLLMAYRRTLIRFSTSSRYEQYGNILNLYYGPTGSSAYAWADFPSGGKLGLGIQINKSYGTFEGDVAIMIHELGHALGFAHANKDFSGSSPIAGTKNYSVDGYYPTIMWHTPSAVVQNLTYDDKLSAKKIYPGPLVPYSY